MADMTLTSPTNNVGILDYNTTRRSPATGVHFDEVYSALINAAKMMEDKLAVSLQNYQDHPDVQANLQQLQYDLQQWNLALTTMTNIQKNMADGLASIASNFR